MTKGSGRCLNQNIHVCSFDMNLAATYKQQQMIAAQGIERERRTTAVMEEIPF